MNMHKAQHVLSAYIAADVPAFLWGAPGIGKSDMVAAVAASVGRTMADVRLSSFDAVDLRGLPRVAGDSVQWCMPDFIRDLHDIGGPSLVFFDEMNTAAPSVMAAALQLILTRRIGPHTLPDDCVIVAAGNRIADRAAANRMPSALANRFAHIDCEADLASWAAWADNAGLSPLVVAFLRFRPELLHKMPEGEARAFPTPRAWAQVAKVADAPDDLRLHLVSGLVGEGAAAEFEGFARVFKSLPSIASILNDPTGAPVPSDPAGRYAVTSGLSRAIRDDDTFGRALSYVERLTQEFVILLATSAAKRDARLAETGAFVKWAIRNADVTL
jgi:hypothetical protein